MTSARAFEILPAIDLRDGRVVRLRQGDFARETAYSEDPAGVAATFANAGARWIHVVDLDAARTGHSVNGAAVATIVAAVGERVRVEVAGGLRDRAAVALALSLGAARVVVGTAALRDPAFAAAVVAAHGAQRIAVAIDVRDGQAIGQGWAEDATGIDISVALDRLWGAGVTTFEVTAIDRDGGLAGPDLGLYERVVGLGRGSIIASGGISTIGDLQAVRDRGCTGVIVGRAIYEGKLDLADAMTVGYRPG